MTEHTDLSSQPNHMKKSVETLKKLPISILDFGRLRRDGYHYVDKTMFLPLLEDTSPHLVFTRPRRFGKSLWLSVLEHYYDVRYADEFDSLFGGLAIGASPTPERNSCHVLRFDFSGVEHEEDPVRLGEAFQSLVHNTCLRFMDARGLRDERAEAMMSAAPGPSRTFDAFIQLVGSKLDRPLYVLIDEYDHFTQSLLATSYPEFRSAVGRGGFYRAFFEVIKSAASIGVVQRSFITGVTPVTLDSMTSGFNITKDISVYRRFEYLLGFTEAEVRAMIAATCDCPELSTDELMADLKGLYDGYRFTPHQGERVYNPDMTLHYLSSIAAECRPPEKVLTSAMATDVGKLKAIAEAGDTRGNLEALEEIAAEGHIHAPLVDSFSLDTSFGVTEFISMLFYMGILTIEGPSPVGYVLAPPNQAVLDIHLRALGTLLERTLGKPRDARAEVSAIMALSLDGDPEPLLLQVQAFLERLSSRDWMRFDEKYVKLVLMMIFARYDGFIVSSEPEVTGIPGKCSGYLTLFRKRRDPTVGNYDVLFELKYLSKKDATDEAVAKALEGAKEQLRAYLKSTDLAQQALASDASQAKGPQGRRHPDQPRALLPVAVVFKKHELAAWGVVD